MVIGGDWWGSGRGWDPIKHRKQGQAGEFGHGHNGFPKLNKDSNIAKRVC